MSMTPEEHNLPLSMPPDPSEDTDAAAVPGMGAQSHSALDDHSADLPDLLDNPFIPPVGIPGGPDSGSASAANPLGLSDLHPESVIDPSVLAALGSASATGHDLPPLDDDPVKLPDLEIKEMWEMMRNGGEDASLRRILEQSKKEADAKGSPASKPEKAAEGNGQSNGSPDPKKLDSDKEASGKTSPTEGSKGEQSPEAPKSDLLKKMNSVIIEKLYNVLKSSSMTTIIDHRNNTSRVVDEVTKKIEELEKTAKESSEDAALQTALISKMERLKFQLKELDRCLKEFMDKKYSEEAKRQKEESVLGGVVFSPFSSVDPQTAPASQGHIMNDIPADKRFWEYDPKDTSRIILKSALNGIVNKVPGNTGLTSDSANRALTATEPFRHSKGPVETLTEQFDMCRHSLSIDHMPEKTKKLMLSGFDSSLRPGLGLGFGLISGAGSRAVGALSGLPAADSASERARAEREKAERERAEKERAEKEKKKVPLTHAEKLKQRYGGRNRKA